MSLNLNNLLADLSVLQKTGDIQISRSGNIYTIMAKNNKYNFTCGSLTENMAFDFKLNNKSILINNIDDFVSVLTGDSKPELKPIKIDNILFDKKSDSDWDDEKIEKLDIRLNEQIKNKDEKTMNQQPIQQNFDLSSAAQNFAQAILSKQTESESLTKRLEEIENKIENFAMPKPLEIKINDLPEINLGENASAILEDLIRAAMTRQNAYIFGPAGCGKTTAAKQVAKALDLPFGYICLTAGASETWLFGRNTPNGFIEGQFSMIYKNGGVFLADEMDAADSNLLIALNTAIDSDELLNPMSGERIKRHKDFIFIGAGNTNGLGATGQYNGRSRLDASTLSRFVFFELNYDHSLEKALCLDKNIFTALQNTRSYLTNRKSENFITTRDFIKLSKMLHAGSSYEFCYKSLVSNFSETEKSEIKKFWSFESPVPKKTKKEKVKENEIPF